MVTETVTEVLHRLCGQIMKTNIWPTQWVQSIIIPLVKKGNLKKCENDHTISLISNPSKVMIRIILNRLQPQVEACFAEEQAGFRAGRSTTEQISEFSISEYYARNMQNITKPCTIIL